MSRTIMLISCGSQKGDKKTHAKDLYRSWLFKSSLSYAYRNKPDKIFILSALHCLLDLDKIISPYDVTLSNVPKQKRHAGLKILTRTEKVAWGMKVIQQLSKQTNIEKDTFIVLAGYEYIKPIKDSITILINPLKGKKLGERVKFLNDN